MASLGRHSNREEGNEKNHGREGPNRRHGSLKQADIRVIRKNIARGRTVHDIGLYLEPLLRKVVQEELPPILNRHRHLFPGCEGTYHQAGTSGSRALRLCFTNKLPATIFTHTRITSEDGAPIGIVLCDASSQNCVVREGPLSCTKIMMCALKGEFGSNEGEDWSEAEFNANISPRRVNKGDLLNGEKFVTLKNGFGLVPDNIQFSDNSRWTRSGRFRLGAKAVENEAAVREGRSEAFVIKDKRGQPYEKHDRPSLKDEIWRLRKIAKGGKIHEQLLKYKVQSVGDLLRLYVMNPHSLIKKMGKVGKKSRDTIIGHAKTCEVEEGERYSYQYFTTSQQPILLLFNSIFELVRVSFDGGHNYRSLELLNSEEKCWVEIAKRNAYENMETSMYGSSTTQTLEGEIAYPDAGQPSRSTSSLGELIQQDEQVENDQMVCRGVGWGADWDVSATVGGLELEKCMSPPLPWLQGHPFASSYVEGPELGTHHMALTSSGGKRKTVWNKIRHALRLVMPFVAKRKAKLSFPFNCLE